MKKLTTSLFTLMFAVSAIAGGVEKKEKVMTVSPDESTIEWHGEKVTGEHNGNVEVRQGNIVLDESGKIQSAYVQVDMRTITNKDLTDEENNAKLVGHLKSDDFFGVEKFPYAEIQIQNFKPGNESGTYVANGDLTIKGKTHPISFPFTMNQSGDTFTASGSCTFDRSNYDVRYGSGSFFDNLGDKTIYDDVDLTFTVKAKAKK